MSLIICCCCKTFSHTANMRRGPTPTEEGRSFNVLKMTKHTISSELRVVEGLMRSIWLWLHLVWTSDHCGLRREKAWHDARGYAGGGWGWLLINWTLYTRGTRIHLYHSQREGVIINGLIAAVSSVTLSNYTLYTGNCILWSSSSNWRRVTQCPRCGSSHEYRLDERRTN